jgi:transcriptional regulator with XRE-family HTH domain
MSEQLSMSVRKIVGEKIRTVREKRGYSLRELESETGLGHSWIAKLEKGQVNFQVDSLVVLLEALKIQPKELFNFKLPFGDE